jgi:hypothetical protein
MRMEAPEVGRGASSMIDQMREGWDYVHKFRSIRSILLLWSSARASACHRAGWSREQQ